MRTALSTTLWMLATLGTFAGYALTVPEPSDVPVTWELEFRHERPRPIQVLCPGEDKPRTFWYLIFTLTNNTKDDALFAPTFLLYTDTGQVIPSDRKVPPVVFDEIRKAHNLPLLKNLTDVTGKILQGEDNAKDGVAIWSDFDPQAGAIDIFVGGLSGETAEVKLPAPITVTEPDPYGKMQTVTKDKILLVKTRRLNYKVPGEAAARFVTEARLVKEEWVMR